MTPPNELEQLAEFQDAIQSDEGLERLRAMQYLQQMNNQGIMGLPQVTQQPVVRRDNGGRITFKNLAEVDAAKEAGQLNVGDTFLVENMPGEFTIDSDGSIGLLELDAGTKAMMEEGTMTNFDIISDQFDPEGNLKSDSFLRKNQDGGPVVNKFMGGGFANMITNLKDSGIFKPTGSTEGNIVSTGSSDGSNVTATSMRVPFMGGSGIATPDPNVSQEQALDNLRNMKGGFGGIIGSGMANAFEQGLMSLPSRGAEGLKETVNYQETQEDPMSSPQAMNNEIVNTQGENVPFNFGAARFLSNAGGPVPLRENTAEGIRERATQGGIVETPNMFRGYGPRYQGGLGGKITDTWGSNEPPIQQESRFQPMPRTDNIEETGRMVEYTPPFIGGMLIPPGGIKPIMVPADEQGNPIMPISKQALGFGAPMSGLAMMRKNPETGNFENYNDPNLVAAQGGYVLDLAGGGSIADAAQGLAGFGRYGDNMLVHMNPDEVAGLMSLGNLTTNPVTGLPEAWGIKSFFKPIRKIVSAVTKPIRKVVKSKAFKALAPLVLAVAAPYALGALAPSVFGAGATALGGALSTSGALGYGLATGLGSMAGNLLGGARFGDAARQGLISGATGGLFKGLGSGNWMGTGNTAAVANAGKLTQVGPGAKNIQAGTQVAKAPVTGGNPFAAAQQSQQAATQAAQASKIGSNILTTPGGIQGYTGTGLQPTITAEGVPTNIAQNLSTPEFSNIQFTTEGVPSAPEATRTGFFGKGPLSNTGGTLGGEGYTGSTFDKIKQVGKNIYADYANPRGVAKLVGMDLMQPNWDEVYASEEAMENQLADMGYTIDTGFDGQRVIRDSSGTVMPSNLTTKELLDRALGRTPRTRLVDRIGFEPNASQFAAKGGLVSLAHGGEFSGKVKGDGHGMEDNVYMPIVEKGQGQQIGTLAVSPSEYVVDAHTMSALGNGNADEGAKVMDSVIAGVRKKAFGTTQQPKEIDGLNALMPMMERA
jgi:hypothetical protein